MTTEEILDRIEELIGWVDDPERTNLMREPRSRFSTELTEVTITSHIKGTPEMIGIALAQFISANADEKTVAQLTDRLNHKIDELEKSVRS